MPPLKEGATAEADSSLSSATSATTGTKLTFWYFVSSLSWFTEIAQDVIRVDVHCHASKEQRYASHKMVAHKPRIWVLGKVPQSPGLSTTVQCTEEEGEDEWLERHWFAILDRE